MATESELLDCIEACRTCGIFFLTTSNFLRRIFTTAVEDPEMNLIRMELLAWKVEINENDGFPQHICTSCIHDFQKIFKFRRSCVDIQQQFHHFFKLRCENKIKIKTELPDPEEEEENNCDFVYVDDLSDGEYDPSNVTPFNIPHVPIKDEFIEEATVPMENAATSIQPPPLAVVNVNGVESTVEEQAPKEEMAQEEDVAAREDMDTLHSSFDASLESSNNSLKCNLCLHISPNEQEHRQHMQRLHEVRNMECHICGKKFHNSTATRLKFHMKWHKLSKHIKCAQCGFYCSSRDTLNEHKRSLHAKVKCEICGKSVLSKRMKAHLQQHQSPTKWPCSYCQDVFNSEAEHEQHIWLIHANEDDAEPAKVDDILLSSNSESMCAYCAKTFANQRDLETHMLQQHPHPSNQDGMPQSNEDKSFGKSYDAQSVQHQSGGGHNSSIDERPAPLHHSPQSAENIFNSDSTSTAGTQSSQESSHRSYGYENSAMETSSQESSHGNPAENVDSDFPLRSTSEREAPQSQTTHEEDEMMFVCAQCTQTFASVEKLCAHHKEHLKKAAFNCHICGKNFDLKFSLNRHLKKHKRNSFN